jgi:hypothetical protein
MCDDVNVPLLRKAVEWAEAEAARPEGGHWLQPSWVRDLSTLSPAEREAREAQGLHLASCGTAYCIAGWVAQHEAGPENVSVPSVSVTAGGRTWMIDDYAAARLGLNFMDADRLFAGSNTIEDVRRIAEEIVGGPL